MVATLLLVATTASALTELQKDNLRLAYTVGAEYGWPETAQVIIMQESLAGKLTRFGDSRQVPQKRSYGVAHMTLGTAKEVIKRHFGHDVYKNDDEIIIALVTNDKFAMHMMMWYFTYLVDKFNGSWSKALLAYNVGPGNVRRHGYKYDPNKYLEKCKWRLDYQIRPFNTLEK